MKKIEIKSDVNWKSKTETPQLDKLGFSPQCLVHIKCKKTKSNFYHIARFDEYQGWAIDGVDGIKGNAWEVIKWAYIKDETI